MANTPKPADTASESEEREESYDEWFLRQVDEGLAEADSPDAVWIPHEEILQDVARRREEFLKQLKKNA